MDVNKQNKRVEDSQSNNELLQACVCPCILVYLDCFERLNMFTIGSVSYSNNQQSENKLYLYNNTPVPRHLEYTRVESDVCNSCCFHFSQLLCNRNRTSFSPDVLIHIFNYAYARESTGIDNITIKINSILIKDF